MSQTFKLSQAPTSEYELFVLMHHGALRRCIMRQQQGETIPADIAHTHSCDTHTLFEYAAYREFSAHTHDSRIPVAA